MRSAFISYSRDDRARVDAIAAKLSLFGFTAWVDSHSLTGGQEWWPRILDEIAHCDAFIAVVSASSLNSDACRRERQYAAALRKPLLPIAIEPITQALPPELAVHHIVNYAVAGEDAAFELAAALAALPPAPPLPMMLPRPPDAPLSYLVDLRRAVEAPMLSQEGQRRALDTLEPALRSSDVEVRDGAGQILGVMGARGDLYADVEHRIAWLKQMAVPGPPVGPHADPRRGPVATAPVRVKAEKKKYSKVAIVLMVLGALFLALIIAMVVSNSGPCYYDYYGNYVCS